MPNTPPLLFVAGPDRSGTTMLTLILSEHSRICLAPENRFIPQTLMSDHSRDELAGKALDAFRERVSADEKLAALKMDISAWRNTLNKVEAISPRKAILDFLECYRDAVSPGADILGHKKNYLNLWQHMKAVFPESKLVTIFRDCRSSAYSASKNLPGQDLIHAASAWAERARESRRFADQYPDDYLELTYETFVSDPEQGCRRVCAFLGIPYEPSMLKYYEGNTNHSRILAGHEEKHRHTAEPVNTNRIDKWKEELSRVNVALVELIAGREMVRKGYEMTPRTGLYWPVVIALAKLFYYRVRKRANKILNRQEPYK